MMTSRYHGSHRFAARALFARAASAVVLTFCLVVAPPVLAAPPTQSPPHKIVLEPATDEHPARFVVRFLGPFQFRQIRNAITNRELALRVFAVSVLPDDLSPGPVRAAPPFVVGKHAVPRGDLIFTPRFPLTPGVTYVATFTPSQVSGNSTFPTVHETFRIPNPHDTPSTRVVDVYPSADVLPENLLKFYIHFSAPMSQRDSYRHIRLLDSAGQPIELPFLELPEELWDPTGRRLTVLFDPGRIKRGLKPRDDVGPPLVDGNRYTLVIEAAWQDADGTRLVDAFRKDFRVVASDTTSPDPAKWGIDTPVATTREPLAVTFNEPLDAALAARLITVRTATDDVLDLPGIIHLAADQRRWEFTPAEPWKSGDYCLVVGVALEDLAGNSIRRPFEVDLTRDFDDVGRGAVTELPFTITSPKIAPR